MGYCGRCGYHHHGQSSPFTSPTVILVDGSLPWTPGIGSAVEVEAKGAEGRERDGWELFLCDV